MDSDVRASASQRVGAKRCPITDSAKRFSFRTRKNWIASSQVLLAITGASKPYRHPDMARDKSQPLVEALRFDTRVVREQLDQSAAFRSRLRDGPLHQLLADAATAAM